MHGDISGGGDGRGGGGSGEGDPGGFTRPSFSPDDPAAVAEDEELREIRAGLIKQSAAIAAAEATRVRLLARAAAIAQARMERVHGGVPGASQMEWRSIAAELGFATRVNDRTMQAHLGDTEQLVRMFPATVDALEAGDIDRAHVTAILASGSAIADDEVRAAFERVVIERATSQTPGRTRAFARKVAERMNPRSIDERFVEANQERRVWVTELDDGMARLEALLPVTEAFGIFDRLTRGAKAIRDADLAARGEHAATSGDAGETPEQRFDERTRDQVRADLFTDLLLTGAPAIDPTLGRIPGGIGAIRAQVQITVPVTTLTGVTVGGCELDGRAPVDSETARRLAGGAPGWERVMTDPVKGTVLEVDRYEPLVPQRRFLDARDVRCRCPGCRQPARRCQIDHNDERQHGGKTHLCNLCNLCLGHHTMKTETEWTVAQLPGGSLQWTSPLGFTYIDEPETRVVFLPDPEPSVGEGEGGVPPF